MMMIKEAYGRGILASNHNNNIQKEIIYTHWEEKSNLDESPASLTGPSKIRVEFRYCRGPCSRGGIDYA